MSSSHIRTLCAGVWLLLVFLIKPTVAGAVETREIARFDTSDGVIEFELLPDLCPLTVANFKYLADTRFYDGTAIHRLVPREPYYIAQGGDPLTRDPGQSANLGSGGPGYTIPDERTSSPRGSHVRGILSMARTSAPNSAGSQFFIMLGSFTNFDGNYAPFGAMTSGDQTLTNLQNEPLAGSNPEFTTPLNRITINSIRIRSEIVSGTLSASYPAASCEGLLHDVGRNILGKYRVTLSTRGTVSGQLQCYNRTLSFSGRLLPVAGSATESECVTHLDVKAATPVRLRLRLRRTGATGGSMSVLVNKLDGSDAVLGNRTENADSTLMAARNLAGPALGERYTLTMDAPSVESGTLGACGYMTFNYLSKSKLCVAMGRLPDGVFVVASFSPGTEGARDVLPLFSQRFLAGAPSFKFRGNMQVAQNQVSYGSLQWYRAAQTAPVATGTFDTALGAALSRWTPPTTGQIFGPFAAATGNIGLIWIGTLQMNAFQLTAGKSAATPYPGYDTAGISLRFTPQDGTFIGTYSDQSTGTPFRREFRGVCVQSGTTSWTRGYSLRNGISLPVVMLPYVQ